MGKWSHNRWAAAAILWLGLCGSVLGDNAPAPDASPSGDEARPRVALVLSGGGARGAAHVGVIRRLEELQVPVDIVIGTSMGAVVGGLYASGLNADELEQVIRDIDWLDAFIDAPPRSDLTYRRKRDDDDFLVNFELGVRDGKVRLPKGLIQAQKLALYLREFSLSTSSIKNFDDLPTPFRAVAADIVTGETVVIGEGDLAQAMRASMSAPGVFAPAEVDGRTLVDGGIAMNLPVEVAQELGADIIIAVDVGFPLLPADSIDSALAVSNQMLTILIERETREQRRLLSAEDLLIQPALGLLSSTDFLSALDAIEIGYQSAVDATPGLQRYALTADRYATVNAMRRQRAGLDFVPAFVDLRTDAEISPRVIQARIATEPGAPLSTERLREDLAKIYGLGLFEQVDYRVVQRGEETGLEIDARAKSWGPGYMRFGIAFEEDFEGSGAFGVSARYLRTAVNRLGAEWRTSLDFGTNTRIETEFFQPLSFDLRYFVAPIVNFEQTNVNLISDADPLARYRLTSGEAGLFFGREISNIAEIRAGIYRGNGDAKVRVGDPNLQRFDIDQGGLRASVGFDTLDDSVFPSQGSRYEMVVDWAREGLGSERDFTTYFSTYRGYRTWGRHTWSVGLDFATANNADNVVNAAYRLGGFLNLSGLDRGAIAAPHAALGKVVYQRRTGRTGGGLFDWPLYLGASIEAGNAWATRDEADFNDLIFNGSLFLRFDTFFGPLFLASGFAEDGESTLYLFLGSPIN
ncbi:MAG: patatin-like phospholipase family protein [Pseudomonadota bacterium]